jgi:hypothetical protein
VDAPTGAERTGRAEGAAKLPVLTWNVFHGRDFPPNETLRNTLRSRLFRVTEDDGTYVQVNRRLLDEYAGLIAAADWDACLLQEVPPSWAGPLASASGAVALRTLTSRNQLRPVTTLLGRWNPDLIASSEGGSNLILVRGSWQPVPGSHRSLLLNPWPGRGLRERRRMSFVRLQSSGDSAAAVAPAAVPAAVPVVCVANLHASGRAHAEPDVRRAAEAAVKWAGSEPLLLGGDFNVRPISSPVFQELERRFGLTGPTAPEALDHLLSRGLQRIVPPAPWPPARRDLGVRHGGSSRLLRLSDHDPVAGVFGVSRA